MADETWVVVTSVSGEIQAEIIKGLLEAQGISVFLNQEGAGRAYGLGVGQLGEVQLLVPHTQEQAALQVLADYEAGKFENPPSDMTPED